MEKPDCPRCGSSYVVKFSVVRDKEYGCLNCLYQFNAEDAIKADPPNPGCCPKGVE